MPGDTGCHGPVVRGWRAEGRGSVPEPGPDRDLLLPLAYAEAGLPRDEVWSVLSSALTGVTYTLADVEAMIERRRGLLAESASGGHTTPGLRLADPAVAERVRGRRADPCGDAAAIVERLLARAPRRPDGSPDWARVHPLVLAALALHAAGTDRLEGLVRDPGFLLATGPKPLLRALVRVTSPAARAAAKAYYDTAPRLCHLPVAQRTALLHLAARRHGAIDLARRIAAGPTRPWTAAWAHPLSSASRSLTGHTTEVFAVAAGQLDDRVVIASSSGDTTVRIWDAATGRPVCAPLTGHTYAVWGVAIGQVQGRTVVVSGSHDKTVRLWDAATGTPLHAPLTGHTDYVTAVAIGQLEGRTVVVSGSHDKTVRRWDAATGRPLGVPLVDHTSYVNAVAIGRRTDGRVVIVAGTGGIMDREGTVRVWDAATGTPLGPALRGDTSQVLSVAICRLPLRTVIVSGSRDGTVRRWDAATGCPIGEPLMHPDHAVQGVAIGRVDGRTVIVSTAPGHVQVGGTVRLWDAATGARFDRPVFDHQVRARAVTTARLPGRTVAVVGTVGGSVRTGDVAAVTPGRPDRWSRHTARVSSIAAARLDGRTVVVSGSLDTTVRLWDAATGRPLADPLIGHDGSVTTVAVGQVRGRAVIVSGSVDRTVRLWDLATGTAVGDPLPGDLGPVDSVAIEQFGRHTLVAAGDTSTVWLWDVATGTPLDGLLTSGRRGRGCGPVRSLALGQPGRHALLVAGTDEGTVQLWDLAAGALYGAPRTGHDGPVTAVAVGQVHRHGVIVSGSQDRTVRLWDAATGSLLGEPLGEHPGPVRSVTIGPGPDGRTVAASGADDGTVRLSPLPGRRAIWTPTGPHSPPAPIQIELDAAVHGLALFPRSRLVVGTDCGLAGLRVTDRTR